MLFLPIVRWRRKRGRKTFNLSGCSWESIAMFVNQLTPINVFRLRIGLPLIREYNWDHRQHEDQAKDDMNSMVRRGVPGLTRPHPRHPNSEPTPMIRQVPIACLVRNLLSSWNQNRGLKHSQTPPKLNQCACCSFHEDSPRHLLLNNTKNGHPQEMALILGAFLPPSGKSHLDL